MAKDLDGISFQEAAKETLAELEAEATASNSEATEGEGGESQTESTDQPEGTDAETDQGFFDELEGPAEEEEGQPAAQTPTTFEVPGHGPISTEELVAGYLKDADYRQKTQELADDRRENENAIALWEALERDPVGTVQRLSSEVSMGRPAIEAAPEPAPAPPPAVDLAETVRAAVDEALAGNDRLATIEQRESVAKTNAVFDRIEGIHDVSLTVSDRQMILNKALDLGTTDLGFVFDGLMSQKDQLLSARKSIKETSSSRGSRGGESNDEDLDGPIEDWDSALAAALKEHGLTQEALLD